MSNELPNNLSYTKDHEWLRLEEGGVAYIGITQHAVDQLGEITMVSLPEVGAKISAHQSFGDIDSVKAVSELYAPLDAEILEVNANLGDQPELVNSEPYVGGWMLKVKVLAPDQLGELLTAQPYAGYPADEA